MDLDVHGETLCALVSASALASSGHAVRLLVQSAEQARALSGREGTSLASFGEPGLKDLFAEQLASGRLQVEPAGEPGRPADAVFVALSPADYDRAGEITANQAANQPGDFVLINQSTFPVGSTERLQAIINRARKPGAAPAIAVSLPDLLQEGAALQGFLRPGHWLLGCDNEQAEQLVREILRPFNRRRDALLVMQPREAEFTKFAVTGMLATRLSYMNELANLADTLNVDIEKVRRGLGADSRIGEAYLYPGCGFGGQNFSRDVMRLADSLEQSGVGSELLDQVLAINERQKEVLFRKLWQHYNANLQGRVVGIWGVAFKPGVEVIDNAPSLKLIEALWAQGASVRVHDPKAMPALRDWAGERAELICCDEPYAVADGADALCLVTEWKPYWSPDFRRLREKMRQPVILDGRNIYDPDYVRENNFCYYGVGRQ